MVDDAGTATAATVTVQKTVNKTIVKKPYLKRKPLGLLKLSKSDIRKVYAMFSETVKSKEFSNYCVLTTFRFVDGTYDALNESDFNEGMADPSDIIGIRFMLYPVEKLGLKMLYSLEYNMTLAPASLILADNDAKFTVQRLSGSEESNCSNLLLEHLQNNVINLLDDKQTFSNKFVSYRNGMIITYLIAVFIFLFSAIQQTKVPDAIETFLLLISSIAIGFAVWFMWRYALLKYNHVVFKSEKPGIESAIRGFIERNRSTIEVSLITLVFSIIVTIIAWLLNLVHI